MRSFIVLLCLVPTLLLAQQSKLETQLKQAIKDKKAEIGIAVIINGKDTVTVNNDIHYPLMSVFKFHQALALADYMGKKKQSLDTRLPIKKSDLKPDTYSPLRDKYPQGGIEMSIADLLRYTLQQSDNNACDILFGSGMCHRWNRNGDARRLESVLSKLDHSVSCCRIIGDIPQETFVCKSVQRLYISDNGGMSNRARPFGCSVA